MKNWNRGCWLSVARLGIAKSCACSSCGKCAPATRRLELAAFVSAAWLSTLLLAAAASAQWNPLNPVVSVQQQADGVKFTLRSGTLQVQVCSDAIIHVVLSPPSPVSAPDSLAIVKEKWVPAKWTFGATNDAVTLTTAELLVTVLRKDSSITFSDRSGKKLFQHTEGSLTPTVVNGERTYHSELYSKLWGSYESFYGLG